MLNPKLKERLVEALTRHLKQPTEVDIHISQAELFTPTKQQEQERSQRLESAKETILDDPRIKELLEMYDATVEVSLV